MSLLLKLLQRLLGAGLTLLMLLAFCLALLRAVPGGPFDGERIAVPEVQAALAARYGTDQGYWQQLGQYLSHAVRGDLGPSFQYADFSVSELLAQALPITLSIGAVGLLAAWLSALPIALFAVAHPGSWLASSVRALSSGLMSTPKFVSAPMLALVFAVWLGWLPSAGLGEPLWQSLLLPSLSLALTQLGLAIRVLYGALIGILNSEVMRAARARGLGAQRLQWRHLLPIALPSALAFLLPSAVAVLTGSAVVEQVYGLPGLGRTLVQAALNRDYTMLLGVVMVSGVIVLAVGWAVELLLGLLDPRRRQ